MIANENRTGRFDSRVHTVEERMCICRYCWECNTVTSPSKEECDVKAPDEAGCLGIYLTKLHKASVKKTKNYTTRN